MRRGWECVRPVHTTQRFPKHQDLRDPPTWIQTIPVIYTLTMLQGTVDTQFLTLQERKWEFWVTNDCLCPFYGSCISGKERRGGGGRLPPLDNTRPYQGRLLSGFLSRALARLFKMRNQSQKRDTHIRLENATKTIPSPSPTPSVMSLDQPSPSATPRATVSRFQGLF